MPLLADPPQLQSADSRPTIPDRLEDLDIPRALVADLVLRGFAPIRASRKNSPNHKEKPQ